MASNLLPKKVSSALARPTLRHEKRLLREGAAWVIGCDEVGRGALAGPVAVGMAVIGPEVSAFPGGLRDSKLLTAKQRTDIAPRLTTWLHGYAVGTASPQEIDEHGLTAALGSAARRAFADLSGVFLFDESSTILLDGVHDYFTASLDITLRVQTRVAADRDCASVSAAAVLAKVHRDQIMVQAGEMQPHFLWHKNKGYGTAEHKDALARYGASDFHRKTWIAALT